MLGVFCSLGEKEGRLHRAFLLSRVQGFGVQGSGFREGRVKEVWVFECRRFNHRTAPKK